MGNKKFKNANMSIASFFESGERTQDKGHVKNLVLLAKSDGTIAEEELLLIHKIGKRIGLTYTQIGSIIDNPDQISVIPPVSKVERFEHMIDMARLIHADGKVEEKELRMISKFAIQIGFTSSEDAHIGSILEMLDEEKTKEEILTHLTYITSN